MGRIRTGISVFILLSCAWGTSVWERSPWDTTPIKSESAKQTPQKKSDDANTLTDSRDGQTYRTVSVNGLTWMAQNLNYSTSGSVCYELKKNCDADGRLYTWHDAARACPQGTRLPTASEWESALSKSAFNQTMRLSGYRAFNHDFYNFATTGVYWTADENPDYHDYAYYFKWENSQWIKKHFYKDQANSVRCVSGSTAQGGSEW